MVYLGRVVGVGIDSKERPFAVYAVSGRSDPSKQRIAEKTNDYTVRIGPSGELLADQKKQQDLIFYNAVSAIPGFNGSNIVVVSNGKQTDPVAEEIRLREPLEGGDYHLAISNALGFLKGAEPDDYRTPRIAGVVDFVSNAALGIATEKGLIASYLPMLSPKIQYVSTYKGDPSDNRRVVIPELKIPLSDFSLSGGTAQQLADNLFDWMDSEFVVCTAAALWNPDKGNKGKWDIKTRNLHE